METACPGFLSLLLRWNTVTVRVSRALLERDRKQLGEKGIHVSLQFHNTTHHQRASRAGTAADLAEEHYFLICSLRLAQPALLRPVRDPCSGVELFTQDGAPLHQPSRKRPPLTDMLTGQSGQATPQLGLPLLHNSSLCQVDKPKSTLPYSAQLKAAVALKNKALGFPRQTLPYLRPPAPEVSRGSLKRGSIQV